MRKIFLLISACAILATACENEATNTDNNTKDSTAANSDSLTENNWETIGEKGGIRISILPESPDFPEAKLTQISPKNQEQLAGGAAKHLFKFNIENFELTKQTEGMAADHCANSKQGQHIHSIIDGEPYTAHYTDTFTKSFKDGNHLALHFLSRSYHESIKHKGAYQLTQFTTGMKGWKANAYNLEAPMLFYSRPKGEYVGADTKTILLDFYLVNTELSETGNKVRATINGNEFTLNRWVPYAITGMPMGDNTIKLELIDNTGKVIEGPYNSVERKITLKEK